MQVYKILKQKIINRRLTSNEQIDTSKISNELGVSTTPVRDAINMLVSEGFAETIPRKGTFVKGIYESDLIEIFEFRSMIETYSLKLGMHNIDNSIMQNMINEWDCILEQGYDELSIIKVDSNLHNYIVESSNNSRIIKAYSQLNCHVQTATGYFRQDANRMIQANNEHREIMYNIIQNDLEGAQSALNNHLNITLNHLLDIIKLVKVF